MEEYILYRRNTNHPNSTSGYYHLIQTFLEMNDVLINFKKMRRLLPAKQKTAVERGWNEDEIRQMPNLRNLSRLGRDVVSVLWI